MRELRDGLQNVEYYCNVGFPTVAANDTSFHLGPLSPIQASFEYY